MGKHIEYWIGYKEFLVMAQKALQCGGVIVRPVSGKLVCSRSLEIVTEDQCDYFFYFPEAGEWDPERLPSGEERLSFAHPSGNTVIAAGFSRRDDENKILHQSRICASYGFTRADGTVEKRPRCIDRLFDRLLRVLKKVAPYTALENENWIHKEYISSEYLRLWKEEGYRLQI